ncbi:MAG: amidohydrolase family protein, partial [Proteobacteria bacterium]|nr:amidohydrolase family protein [Pseudomonadota bacterium]
IIPGLFNSHSHVAMGFFRGLGHGRENMIESFLFPAEKSLTHDLTEPLSYSYILDGLRSGVTSFVDHYYFSAGIGRAFEKLKVRAWVGETIADLGGAFPGRDSFDRARSLIASSDFSSLIRHVIALSQTSGELKRVRSLHRQSPVEFAAACGALSPKSLVVHLTSASESDLQIVKDHGAAIGWCPSSTIIFDRLAPIDLFFAQGHNLALGTDCPASCDHADILSEIRTAGLLARDRGADHKFISPDHLLAMATTIPAKVLGAERDLGTLEVGKLADLVVLHCGLSALPAANPMANVIYSMGSRDVTHVMIDGKWIIWDRGLVSASEADLKSSYLDAVKTIQTRVKAQ